MTDKPPAKPRASSKRQRNKQVLVRFLDEEFNRAAEKADKSGLALAALLRTSVLQDPGPRAQRRPPADHRALRQILGELGRIGNNLNQIARALNTGERASLPELQKALRAYLDLRQAIFNALGKDPGPGP